MMSYIKYLGLTKKENETIIKEIYTPVSDIKVAERYLTYLKEIDSYQQNRRTAIENKNAQLVGQASIVTSIFALFIPLLLGSFNDLCRPIQITLSTCFLIILTHYLLAIFHAIKTLKINKYEYPTIKTSTITKTARATKELDFLNEQILDLIYIVNHTPFIDNKKGENLIYASRCFEVANIGFGIFTALIIVSAFFIIKPKKEIKVNNLNEIQLTFPDTIKTKLTNQITVDTTAFMMDSSNNLFKNKKP
jgi:hypothetical protein